jgi:hypothetical protein
VRATLHPVPSERPSAFVQLRSGIKYREFLTSLYGRNLRNEGRYPLRCQPPCTIHYHTRIDDWQKTCEREAVNQAWIYYDYRYYSAFGVCASGDGAFPSPEFSGNPTSTHGDRGADYPSPRNHRGVVADSRRVYRRCVEAESYAFGLLQTAKTNEAPAGALDSDSGAGNMFLRLLLRISPTGTRVDIWECLSRPMGDVE